MTLELKKITEIIEAEILSSHKPVDSFEINNGYASDLLSDVMGNAGEGLVWITIMRHLNTIAVASLAGIPMIIFSKGAVPDEPIIAKANLENICLISSKLSTFEIAGRIYNLIKK